MNIICKKLSVLFVVAAFVMAIGNIGPAFAADLTPGAKLIADEAAKDKEAAKKACMGGVAGVTKYVTEITVKLMQAGKTVDPASDPQAAGAYLGSICPKFFGG